MCYICVDWTCLPRQTSAKKEQHPDIVRATTEFEKWASRHGNLIRPDAELKHRNMAQAPHGRIWANHLHTAEVLSRKLVDSAVRIRDPHLHFLKHRIVRRLAPDGWHIEINTLPEERDEERMLHSVGRETATSICGANEGSQRQKTSANETAAGSTNRRRPC